MRRATAFFVVYSALAAAIWAVTDQGSNHSPTPLEAAAAAVPLPVQARPAKIGMAPITPMSPWLGRLGEDLDQQLKCLALNVYWEARSEPALGKFAVAAVTLNRVLDAKFPDTICDVVRQGGEDRKHRCQFSWWCDGKSDRPADGEAWVDAQSVAYTVLYFDPPDPTRGALWYHADYVQPSWSKVLAAITRIGRHIYYGAEQSADAGTGRS